jgi:hypothetical protein
MVVVSSPYKGWEKLPQLCLATVIKVRSLNGPYSVYAFLPSPDDGNDRVSEMLRVRLIIIPTNGILPKNSQC